MHALNVNSAQEDGGGIELQYMYPHPHFYAPQDFYGSARPTPLPFGQLPGVLPVHHHHHHQTALPAEQPLLLLGDDDAVDDTGLQKRCQNCGRFFLNKDNSSSACAYHPGVYHTPDFKHDTHTHIPCCR
eukprot:TRINITY_DN1476_c0_g1_i2.p1 TRINITY_DN1476_c0_g1~~TRINITY_DN1476_c0_g1_i2.p1  ORF type:complete len:129 (-),score=23.64 TRINITY_DN1476_c0_g1_i2:663-1049(-)